MITAVFSTMGHDTSCVDKDNYLSEIRSEINKTYIFFDRFSRTHFFILLLFYFTENYDKSWQTGKLGNSVPETPLVHKELTWPIVLKTAVSSQGTMDI